MPAESPISDVAAPAGALEYARALLNILEDSDGERERLYEVQRAVVNILEDLADERARLQEMKSSVLNILEDLAADNERLEQSRAELLRSDQAIRLLNETLEKRVEERTVQLLESNRELEAFSYSVSHDLRAPLRAVEGFASILLRDYPGKQLDEQAAHYMTRMQAACQRMGQLIEGLLVLSRIIRQDLNRQRVNLTAIASEVLAELSSRDPHRVVECRVESGLFANADARLMNVAISNLLTNAWKFTNRTNQGRIAMGSQPDGVDTVYFIRDNGAGFDMAYAEKLFKPFQRLHSANEFEGSGIGLATVQRIIRRHGGRIWAEGSPGQGATFYFTVGGG
jgi:light-regulated signal transduction histidine kinase (bacteriophytochrome)